MLLRGTPLYDRRAELKLIESSEMASPNIDRIHMDIPPVISSPSFTYDDWKTMAKMADALEEQNKKNGGLFNNQQLLNSTQQ